MLGCLTPCRLVSCCNARLPQAFSWATALVPASGGAWAWAAEPRAFASELAGARAFYPRMFTVAPSYSALSTPWFFDYAHLLFWFFFLATLVIVLWLVYFLVSVTHNVETRRPVRETRGFSRAQTGDALTAVLPMTWSVTMLMHASTHSANFDENTAATALSFAVVAYQWGWNYYFPRDVLERLSGGARIVGRGRAEVFVADDLYPRLMAAARGEFVGRVTALGAFAARHGRHNAPSALALFARPVGAPQAGLEPALVRWGLTPHRQAGPCLAAPALVWAGSRAEEVPGAGLLGGAYGARGLDRARSLAARLPLTRAAAACGGASVADVAVATAAAAAPVVLGPSWGEGQLAVTARDRSACALVGNRLALVHSHLAQGARAVCRASQPARRATLVAHLRGEGQAHMVAGLALPGWQLSAAAGPAPLELPNVWAGGAAGRQAGWRGVEQWGVQGAGGLASAESAAASCPMTVGRLRYAAGQVLRPSALEPRGASRLLGWLRGAAVGDAELALGGVEVAQLQPEDLGLGTSTAAALVHWRAGVAEARAVELAAKVSLAGRPAASEGAARCDVGTALSRSALGLEARQGRGAGQLEPAFSGVSAAPAQAQLSRVEAALAGAGRMPALRLATAPLVVAGFGGAPWSVFALGLRAPAEPATLRTGGPAGFGHLQAWVAAGARQPGGLALPSAGWGPLVGGATGLVSAPRGAPLPAGAPCGEAGQGLVVAGARATVGAVRAGLGAGA
jgi:heme/copper-type cytochrome/quinol oxidase subunit 2